MGLPPIRLNLLDIPPKVGYQYSPQVCVEVSDFVTHNACVGDKIYQKILK